MPLVIIGGAALIVAIVGATAAVSGVALYKSIKNEENLEHLQKEVKWLENKAEILKKMAHTKFITQNDFKNAIETIEKKVNVI